METTVGCNAAGSYSPWVENTLLQVEVWKKCECQGSQLPSSIFPDRCSLRDHLPPHAPFVSITFALKNKWLHVLPLGTKINVNSSSMKAFCACCVKEVEQTTQFHTLLGFVLICKYPSLISTPGRVLHPGNCPAELQEKIQTAFPGGVRRPN